MDIESLREYCISLDAEVEESFPFGEDTLVFKINNKIFALMALEATPLSVNLKCDPDLAIEYRESYSSVKPRYHMNKKHWNTVILDGEIDAAFLKKMIQDSFDLVAKTKKTRTKKDEK